MAESNFKSTMEALFHGMDNVISSKTVVGEAIHVKDYRIFYMARLTAHRLGCNHIFHSVV